MGNQAPGHWIKDGNACFSYLLPWLHYAIYDRQRKERLVVSRQEAVS